MLHNFTGAANAQALPVHGCVSAAAHHSQSPILHAGHMQLVETVPLLNNSKHNQFVGVNLYVDDTGAIKNLPVNVRATDICKCCAHRTQVLSPSMSKLH